MSSRLADRIRAARHARFVGRGAELALFQSVLATAEFPFFVLYVHGPGGVGKSSLLHEFAALCPQAGVRDTFVDGRNIEPSPEGFNRALATFWDLPPHESILEFLADHPQRQVILVDTCETLAPLEEWLRHHFLPQLPENTLIVLASRNPPAPDWISDPGWQALIRLLPLRNLSPEESRSYLVKRAIPLEQHTALLHFTHGHPLALSLVADLLSRQGEASFRPEDSPHVIKTLLGQFMEYTPDPSQRAALEACALVRVTTESLLRDMLVLEASQAGKVHALFDWLREISFIEASPEGLFPHDLARQALATDLRWRNPDWYAELHRRARRHYTIRLNQAHGQAQQRLLLDYVYLHRENPIVRPYFEWQASSSLIAEVPSATDIPALVQMTRQHEGVESAHLAHFWLQEMPHSTAIWRTSSGEPLGFLMALALQLLSPAQRAADPAVRAAWSYLSTHAPLRPGEGATLFRFWMAADTYQSVSPTQSLIFIHILRHYLTTPGLAYTLFPCAEIDFWVPMLRYAHLARLPEADFEIQGRRYGVFGHDWRIEPPLAWLAALAEKEIATAPLPVAEFPSPEPLLVLSEAEFAGAVRAALRDYPHPPHLAGNPLLRSRFVVEKASHPAERVEALLAQLRQAAESLKASPRSEKLYRALDLTYFHPAPTQEIAAERLDLPFSTYRRHLRAGIQHITSQLWQQEVGNS